MRLFAQRDAEEFAKTGEKVFRFNRDIRLTPGARDVFAERGVKVIFEADGPAPSPATAPAAPSAGGTRSEWEKLFRSPEAESLKQQICEIGKRCWQRDYCDGNGGNISARLGDVFICTPTGVSKGFMKPEMMCLVDIDGNQLAGTWKRTSEILTHMAIYRAVPQAKAVAHAHPVYATAFAMAGLEPPQCLIPEMEVFVGRAPLAPYRTPGSADMQEVIKPLAPKHQSILMGNHGVICWGTSVEDAYFKMEITDAYCRTVVVASHLPTNRTTIPAEGVRELLDIKKKLGLPDPREDYKPVQLCEVDPWNMISDRPCGCSSPASGGGADAGGMTNAELEALVQRVTDEIMRSTGGKS